MIEGGIWSRIIGGRNWREGEGYGVTGLVDLFDQLDKGAGFFGIGGTDKSTAFEGGGGGQVLEGILIFGQATPVDQGPEVGDVIFDIELKFLEGFLEVKLYQLSPKPGRVFGVLSWDLIRGSLLGLKESILSAVIPPITILGWGCLSRPLHGFIIFVLTFNLNLCILKRKRRK